MRIIKTPLEGLLIVENMKSEDDRGFFQKYYSSAFFSEIGFEKIVQVNHSYTKQKGSIRGMHYQIKPYCEAKIIKCMKGRVFDVLVDIRKGSDTFLQHFSVELAAEKNTMIYVPRGFAHGFQTLEDDSELLYLHDNNYELSCERSINYHDSRIAIKWPLKASMISEKDKKAAMLGEDFEGIEI